ncbi:MAG: glycosyltransferase [Lachnospiraceae bacterium]|nr:glycosyltransferase [Lachnospiraceae bacterium]
MDKRPIISVIVPVYNQEKYLIKCLDSLLGQTYSDKEIVLVDDGSTDISGRICDEYAAKDGSVIVVHKENGGLVSAWKTGFDHSTGDYVTFVDSDDYVETTMLSEMANLLIGVKGEVVLSDYAITKEDGSETFVYQTLNPGEYTKERIKKEIVPNLLGREKRIIAFSRCMKLIERSLIANNYQNCDERIKFAEDSTIILPVLFDSNRIFMMDKKVYYHYRYINESMVHKYDKNAYENIRLYYEIIKRIIEEKFGYEPETKQYMLDCLNKEEILLFLHLVKNEVRGNPKQCHDNLVRLVNDEFVAEKVKNYRIKLTDIANILPYRVLKNPNYFNITLLKLAFKIYYAKKRGA